MASTRKTILLHIITFGVNLFAMQGLTGGYLAVSNLNYRELRLVIADGLLILKGMYNRYVCMV